MYKNESERSNFTYTWSTPNPGYLGHCLRSIITNISEHEQDCGSEISKYQVVDQYALCISTHQVSHLAVT